MRAMTRQTVVEGLLDRWDFYTSLVSDNGWKYTWYENAKEILLVAMWINAITPDQFNVLADMLWEEYKKHAYAE